MTLHLNRFLAILSGERSYKRSGRSLLIFSLLTLTIFAGLCAAFAYFIWQYWPTLLFSDFLGSGVFTLISFAYSLFTLLRIPLVFTKLQNTNSSEPFALALALRHALARGDEAVAPVLTDQVVEDGERLFSGASVDAESLVVAVPALLVTSLAGSTPLYVLAALALVMAGVLASILIPVLIPVTRSDPMGLIILVVLCGGLALGALVALIAAMRLSRRHALQRRGMTIGVDSLGLTFRQPVWKKQPHHIAWMEMRALAQFTYKDKYTRLQTVYLLDSENQTLLWAEPPDEAYAPPHQRQTIADRRESARRLALAITSRTRLPIRNLTDTIAALTGSSPVAGSTTTTPRFLNAAWDVALFMEDVETATMIWHVRQPGAQRQPQALRKLIASQSIPGSASADPTDATAAPAVPPRLSRWVTQLNATLASVRERRQLLLRVARALLPYYPTETSPDIPASFRRYLRHERLQRALTWLNGFSVIFLLVALLITTAAGWYQERGVERMLRGLSQQTEAQTPLYFASFRRPLADWDVHRSTKDDPYTLAFVNGAYQISSDDQNSSAYAWIQRDEEGDIAISTIVTIHGSSAKGSYTTAGVMFDVTAGGNEFSTFGVDDQGNWNLLRYDENKDANNPWNYVDENSSPAIHTGDGATNTLLLLRHGSLYLLYINNTLVDRYYDLDHSLPPGGDVGVYIDDGDIVARFNDFTIYPIPPQLATVPIATNFPEWMR
jgi:hypothetical protein